MSAHKHFYPYTIQWNLTIATTHWTIKCGRNSGRVVIMKLHQFAGQVRVWSAGLKGEPLVNLVAFKKPRFQRRWWLNTRGVNSNTCHFCLDLYYIFHECQVFLSTEEFQLLDEIHCFSITLYRTFILFQLFRFLSVFSTFSFKDSSRRFGAICSDFMNFTYKATIFK